MPASTPAPVMLHIPVDRLDIVHGPGRKYWIDLQHKGGETEVSFTLRSGSSPRTFERKFIVHDIRFEPGTARVDFHIKLNQRRLNGSMNLDTGKGRILTA